MTPPLLPLARILAERPLSWDWGILCAWAAQHGLAALRQAARDLETKRRQEELTARQDAARHTPCSTTPP